MAAALSPDARTRSLAALQDTHLDVLVVGGGITGAGVARDAALRGLTVGLVEAVDFAAGTSSRSSKLIHGGVRYLQQGDVALVREAATERATLRRIAPHLALPVLMVMPTHGRASHLKLNAGLWTFERLAGIEADERHEMWSCEETVEREPTISGERLYGAATYTEYLTDDARLVLENVKGAHVAGATCVNHAEVTSIGRGRVTVRDVPGGNDLTVRARVVVNAAGPWVGTVQHRAGVRSGQRLQLTKGVHLVVRHARLPLRHVVVMSAPDKRPVFAIPRDTVTYLGTTDTLYGEPTLSPEVTRADAEYLLEAAARTFAVPPLGPDDVVGAWAGLRPLLHQEGKAPSEISRRDEIVVDPDGGLVSIAGGKLTTYRRMAERVVDIVEERLGRRPTPCTTGEVPLSAACANAPTAEELSADLPDLPPTAARRLVRLYGADAGDIVARALRLVDGGRPRATALVDAEIEHALENEMALTLTDLLERRMRLLLFDANQGRDLAVHAAERAAARLGWSSERREAEVAGYMELADGLRSFR